ncbi:hypothetical protein ACER0A_009005 [Haloimpatiens sp. FM7315]|uniref:hypothetical protein n=1 Tax=Haloimpatiens sp. FM7315 TaxID=3298609 RepID=UPI0035A32C39
MKINLKKDTKKPNIGEIKYTQNKIEVPVKDETSGIKEVRCSLKEESGKEITKNLEINEGIAALSTENSFKGTIKVDMNKENNKETISYIKDNLNKDGNIYLLGEKSVVAESIIDSLKSEGFSKFKRLGGKDK